MRKKTIIIGVSLIFAMFIMAGGYGYWSEILTIKGTIKVEPSKEEVEAILNEIQLKQQEMEKSTEESETDEPEDNGTNEIEQTEEPEKEDFEEENEDNIIEEPNGEDTGEAVVEPTEDSN